MGWHSLVVTVCMGSGAVLLVSQANPGEMDAVAAAAAGKLLDREVQAESAFRPGKLHELGALSDDTLLSGAVRRIQVPKSIDPSNAEVPLERSWFGLVYNVPMLFTRLPPELMSALPNLTRWLVHDREPVWSALPENPDWNHDEKRQLTGRYRFYNALQEALGAHEAVAPGVARAASNLRKELLANLLHLWRGIPSAVESMQSKERKRWRRWLRNVSRNVKSPTGQVAGPFPIGLHVQSWMNAHRADREGEEGLSMHNHEMQWHGYLLVDAEPSNTTYVAPALRSGSFVGKRTLFNLNNANGVLVLLCGGINHAVLPLDSTPQSVTGAPSPPSFAGARPRVSMAFDFVFSTTLGNGMLVQHPGAEFDAQSIGKVGRLDIENKWMQLASAEELQDALKGKHPLAFDWHSLLCEMSGPGVPAHRCGKQPGNSRSNGSIWGGVVHLKELVGPEGQGIDTISTQHGNGEL